MEKKNFHNFTDWAEVEKTAETTTSGLKVAQCIQRLNDRHIELKEFWNTLGVDEQEFQRDDYFRELNTLVMLQQKFIRNLIDLLQIREDEGASNAMSIDVPFVVSSETFGEQALNDILQKFNKKNVLPVRSNIDGDKIEMNSVATQINARALAPEELGAVVVVQTFPYEGLNSLLTRLWSIKPMGLINKGHVRDFMKELAEVSAMAKRKFPNFNLPEEAIVSSVHCRLDIPSRVMFARDLKFGQNPFNQKFA